MAREQQTESRTGTSQGNGGTESGYRAETRQSRQGDGGSRSLAPTGRRGGLVATRGWPGLLGGGIPASPWELVRRMSEEMNQLFESLGGTGVGPSPLDRRRSETAPLLVPRTEVIRQPNALLVRVEMPGLAPEDIDVSVEDGELRISGERRQEQREEGDGFVRSEIVYGTFFRTIPLPEGADEDNVVAVVRNGVLEVSVPISEQRQGRRVAVQPGSAESARIESGRGTESATSGEGEQATAGSTAGSSGSGTSSSSGGASHQSTTRAKSSSRGE